MVFFEYFQFISPLYILISENKNLTIKCDLQERVLNPAQLPFYEQFVRNFKVT